MLYKRGEISRIQIVKNTDEDKDKKEEKEENK